MSVPSPPFCSLCCLRASVDPKEKDDVDPTSDNQTPERSDPDDPIDPISPPPDDGRDQGPQPQVRVFKKASLNGKMTIFLSRREFIDYMTSVEPIDGVVIFDLKHLKDLRIFCQIIASFRYGREEDEVMGLTFCKEMTIAFQQIYPSSLSETENKLTSLQAFMKGKHSTSAHPFHLQLPPTAPASVILFPTTGDNSKPCGVQYELVIYAAPSAEHPPDKWNTIRMSLQKTQYVDVQTFIKFQPNTTVIKHFLLHTGKLEVQALLDKQIYYHRETIKVHVDIKNNSHKSLKKMKVSVVQITDICLFASGRYKTIITFEEIQFPCRNETSVPGSTYSNDFCFTPVFTGNKALHGVVLEKQENDTDVTLASSTLFPNSNLRDVFGFLISYVVKIKLTIGSLTGRDLVAELPFLLVRKTPS